MNNITIDKANIKDLITNKTLIPDFQRTFVWNEEKQRELIYSVINGYPIGVVLFFETNEKTLLIDGLQRMTTIKLFSKNPNVIFNTKPKIKKFINETNVCINVSQKIPSAEKEIEKLFIQWFESISSKKDLSKLFAFMDWKEMHVFAKKYSSEHNVIYEDLVGDIYDAFTKTIDISYYQIPVMKYSGREEQMPIIFGKINKNSQVLTQYEVFSALWHDKLLRFNDEDINLINKFNSDRDVTSQGNERPIINNFKILASKLEDIDKSFSENVTTLKTKDFNTISFEIYSVLFHNTNNLIGTFIESIDFTDNTESFFRDINKLICVSFHEIYNEILNNKYDEEYYTKNIFLYYIALKVKSRYNISLDNQCIQEEAIKIPEVFCGSLNLIKENNWFRDENRQITFFKEKCEQLDLYVNTMRNKNAVNIDAKAKIIEGEIIKEEVNYCNVEYEKKCIKVPHLEDVNNEPYNKRIQGRIIKEAINSGNKVEAIYSIPKANGFLVVQWDLNNVEKANLLDCKNPSLKVSLHDIQRVFKRGYNSDLITSYKYPYIIKYFSTE